MTPNRFSQSDVQFLRDNHATMTVSELGRSLGKRPRAVHEKLGSLGLSRKLSLHRWSKEEIEFLIQNSPTMSRNDMAVELNRTIVSVRVKCKKMGLRAHLPKEDWSLLEDDTLRLMYGRKCDGKLHAGQVAERLGRSIDSVKMRAHKLGLGRKYDQPLHRGGLRLCRKCGEYKLRSDFSPHRKMPDGLTSWCRACHNRYKRIRLHEGDVHSKYGIRYPEWKRMYLAQNGKCAICGKPIADRGKGAKDVGRVDHDHATGQIRGLLCNHCNSLLGYAGDRVEVLKKAIAYLWRSRLRMREVG